MKFIEILIKKHSPDMHYWFFMDAHFIAKVSPKHNINTSTLSLCLMNSGVYTILCFFFKCSEKFRGSWTRKGKAGRPPVSPPLPHVVNQPNPRQQAGSGQRGRGRGNQRRPRVAVIATNVDEGEAGRNDQEAAQHAAESGADASLHPGQGNWLAPTLVSQEIIGGYRDRKARVPIP